MKNVALGPLMLLVATWAGCSPDDTANAPVDTGSTGCTTCTDAGDDAAPDAAADGADPDADGGESDGCVPTSCSANGYDCGTVSDGCDGWLLCGECESPQICGGTNLIHVCGVPGPTPIVNGRFVTTGVDGARLTVTAQLNTNTGADDLGGATVVVRFDDAVIDFSASPVPGEDYLFHDFSGGNYSPATVTRPIPGELWLNIDLPPQSTNQGTVVAGLENWTDVVSLTFQVVDPTALADLHWAPDSIYWAIYDADAATLWEPGVFEDLLDVPLSAP